MQLCAGLESEGTAAATFRSGGALEATRRGWSQGPRSLTRRQEDGSHNRDQLHAYSPFRTVATQPSAHRADGWHVGPGLLSMALPPTPLPVSTLGRPKGAFSSKLSAE